MRERGSGTRETLEKALGTPLFPVLELGNTEAIKSVVALGAGISCVSRSAVKGPISHKKLIAIKTPFLNLARDFSILWHKEKSHTLLTDAFISAIQKK